MQPHARYNKFHHVFSVARKRCLLAGIPIALFLMASGFLPMHNQSFAGKDESVRIPSGRDDHRGNGPHGTSSILQRILAWKTELSKGLDKALINVECGLQLYDAMRFGFAAEWQEEHAKRSEHDLAKDAKAKPFLTTWHTWQALVRQGQQSLQVQSREGHDVCIRMVEAVVTIPVAESKDDLGTLQAGDAISASQADAILSELVDQYSTVGGKAVASDNKKVANECRALPRSCIFSFIS